MGGHHRTRTQELRPELLNFFSDWIYERGSELAPKVDFSIANKGGLRDGLPAGKFSKGQIINILPFRNYVTVIDVKGSDLRSVFDVMAKTDGNGVSRNVKVTYDTIGGRENYAARDIMISASPSMTTRPTVWPPSTISPKAATICAVSPRESSSRKVRMPFSTTCFIILLKERAKARCSKAKRRALVYSPRQINSIKTDHAQLS